MTEPEQPAGINAGERVLPLIGTKTRVSRRAALIGAGAAGLTAVAAGAAVRLAGNNDATPPPAVGATGQVASPVASPVSAAASPATSPVAMPAVVEPVGAATPTAAGTSLAPGMALVTSPRLPLFGIGPEQVQPLLAGQIEDWQALGSAVSLPVELVALDGQTPATLGAPEATFPDYEALAADLAARPGGVTEVPIDLADFRVNVLAIGENDPLRDRADGDEPTIKIAVVGDIVPGRNVHQKMVAYGDFSRPFREVAPTLAAFDLTIANLEGNLSSTLPQPADPNTFSFVSDPAMLDGFKLAGIDAVSLANNHSTFNEEAWGTQGLLDTIDALESARMPFFGAGRNLDQARAPWITEVKGKRIAVLGVDAVTANHEVEPGAQFGVVGVDVAAGPDSEGTNPWDTAQFLADIAAATEQADIVIPYFHGGVEYVAIPPQWLVDGAHAAIDAGATLVVTNHPHVIQGMEIYAGKPIVYSPGNFIFDQMFSVEVRSGLILDLTLRGDRVVGLRCHGVEIQDFHQPRLMVAGEQAGLMDRFWRSTDRTASGERA
jgi:hypothetical protein